VVFGYTACALRVGKTGPSFLMPMQWIPFVIMTEQSSSFSAHRCSGVICCFEVIELAALFCLVFWLF
jgi:hypothetical protein